MSNFQGFPRECVDFLKNLRENNNKMWFEDHKNDYERFFLEPSREFVVEMGIKLRGLVSRIHAEPMVNKSLFKIHRDVRFSKDKTPFKTNLAIWFWEGERKRMECSGFYFHLEPDMLMVGTGIYIFPKELLELYRKAVSNEEKAGELKTIFSALEPNYGYGNQGYKKVPRGYDKEYKHADLLLYKGVTAYKESPVSDILFSPGILEYCLKAFTDMLPLHTWLVNALG